MNNKFKKPLIFTLIMLPFAAVGSYFAILMSLSSINNAELNEAIAQIGSIETVVLLSMIQPVLLTLGCAFFGYILSEKIGLMRSFKFSTKPLCAALITALLGGALFSLDAWTFGKWIDEVGKSYEGAGSFDLTEWIASVIYGGIVEEVLMRLFLMSLLAFIMWKLFYKKENSPPSKALITANIVSALLFAAGHLPSTLLTFGTLTPLLLLRCFLLNGAFGLIFGYFYRKHGIQYSMLLHMLFHIVSRSIWMIAL